MTTTDTHASIIDTEPGSLGERGLKMDKKDHERAAFSTGARFARALLAETQLPEENCKTQVTWAKSTIDLIRQFDPKNQTTCDSKSLVASILEQAGLPASWGPLTDSYGGCDNLWRGEVETKMEYSVKPLTDCKNIDAWFQGAKGVVENGYGATAYVSGPEESGASHSSLTPNTCAMASSALAAVLLHQFTKR